AVRHQALLSIWVGSNNNRNLYRLLALLRKRQTTSSKGGYHKNKPQNAHEHGKLNLKIALQIVSLKIMTLDLLRLEWLKYKRYKTFWVLTLLFFGFLAGIYGMIASGWLAINPGGLPLVERAR